MIPSFILCQLNYHVLGEKSNVTVVPPTANSLKDILVTMNLAEG